MSEVSQVPLRPIKRGVVTRLWLGIVAAVLVAVALAWAGTSKSVATSGTDAQFLAWNKGQSGVIATPSGLQYKVLEPGEGAPPTDADVVRIDYKGMLRDGTVFDQAEQAVLPVTGVVSGFSEALKLMPRGAKYRVWIPAELGYGARTAGSIPANSLLVFDITLLDYINEAQLRMQMQMMQAQQGMGAGAPPPGGGR